MISPRLYFRRPGAIRWSTLIFLVCFTIFLIVITPYVLIPGLEAIQEPAATTRATASTAPTTSNPAAASQPTTAPAVAKLTPAEKRSLQAWYRLLVFVLLFILFAGIVITFRFGRFFFPRNTAPRTQTQYVDAWAESARRMQVPARDEDEDDEDNAET
jgi:hypothetical protein